MHVTPGDEFDPRLVRRARGGHRGSRADLVRELQDVWYRYCLAMLRNDEDARDATQETALRFLAGLPRFRGESRLKTWSLGIALNVCREARRSRARAASPLAIEAAPASPSPAPDEAAAAAEEIDRLWDAVSALPDRQREAVVLRFLEGLSVQETADAMGCAAGTVKATVSQALTRLRGVAKASDRPGATTA